MRKFAPLALSAVAIAIALVAPSIGRTHVQSVEPIPGRQADAPTSNENEVATTGPATTSSAIRGELSKVYSSIAALTGDASVIIVGRILSSAPQPYENVPFTISKVSAEQVLKGSVPAGALLDVFETGGVMAPRPARGNAVQATRPLEYSFEGVPVVKPGERYLLFLTGPTSGAAASGVYTLVGEFQGKHLIDASGTIRFTGNAQELGGVEFATARATNGRPATDIIQEVQGSIR